ncbi:aldehyde dehydrogenase family protein [Halorubrum sp. Atlit-8R]|uniref:aldehyde dehydrogenase family protein n=1 Tax=unclassified Halorubrum TaxID=2642239 RepID=UPI000EF29185|nr:MULTISPECIES: aldehyde dehydrogenase family protein [unclassified Halorubrum]RLM71163.1 aldehyde dehydrogenase family protein [Halorubrum sp. Atlit-9R]RLM72031.1 aldehyde dehydrogenase family protein [Halorubrum sp. Atlit-9R]RLM82685.1 aldehyde dehydrogenase family protein [Halorubrum sp. Atlit-8R]
MSEDRGSGGDEAEASARLDEAEPSGPDEAQPVEAAEPTPDEADAPDDGDDTDSAAAGDGGSTPGGSGTGAADLPSRASRTVAASRAAADDLAAWGPDDVDALVRSVGERLADRETVSRLARSAANETGRGHPGTKAEKIATALDAARRTLRDAPTAGVVDRDGARGTVTVAGPVGVVGAAVPATHPVVIPAVLSLYALAARNAVVFAPSPSTVETCDVVVETVRRALSDAGAPTGAVSMLPAPAAKPETDALFERADLVVAAGSAATVAAGQRCGTPNLAAGADGVVAVADGSVPAEAVATRLAVGATYDFGAHPAGDAAVVTVSPAVGSLCSALESEGGYVLDAAERDRLRSLLADAEAGATDPRGNSPRWLAAELDLPSAAREAAFLVAEPDGADDRLAALPGIPAVAVHGRSGFDGALALAAGIGSPHAAAVHTTQQRRARRAAERLAPGRLVVNQPGIAATGARSNGFEAAPVLGGGAAEGSQLRGGLTPDRLAQTATVAATSVADEASHRNGAGDTLRGP